MEKPISKNNTNFLLMFIIIFGVGVGNFGTGIRHRSKFVIMLILLAAPKISKLIFYKKEKINV